MKKTNYKILLSVLFMFLLFAVLGCNKSEAASASVSASSKNVSVGDKVSINVSVKAATWNVYVKGAVSDSIVGYDADLNTKTTNKSYSLNTSKAGTYTVSISGTVKDSSGKKDVSDSVTVTVKEKASSRDNTTTNNNSNNNTNTNSKTEEPTFKSVNDTVYASKDNINIRKSYSADSEKIGSVKLGEQLTRTGIGSNGWSKVSYNGSVGYVSTALITTEQPKKSDDKSLKSLVIEGVELAPAFDPEITDYGVTVNKDVEKLDIKAEASSDKSKVEISGNEKLQNGDNIIKITVTAEDGTTRIYTINTNRKGDDVVTLASLKVNGYTLNPKFSSDVTEYRITILDANVNSVDILASASQTDAKVEISGNKNLKDGENVVVVKVTSADGTITNTYKIIVTRNVAAATTDTKTNWILYAGIGIIALLVLAIVVVIIISKKRAEYDDDDEYEDDNYDDLYGSSKENKILDKVDDETAVRNGETDSIYGDFSAKANRELNNQEDAAPKYEDGFKANAYNTASVYGDLKEDIDNEVDALFKKEDVENEVQKEEVKSDYDYNGPKDVNYYNDKISELFDKNEETGLDKTTGDAFGYLSSNENVTDENRDYTSMQNDWNDDDNRPRKSKGKHAK